MTRGPLRVLEMAMFATVFAAGAVLSWFAITGDGRGAAVAADRPVVLPGPGTVPPPPAGGELPQAGPTGTFPEVAILRADSEIVPPASGCRVTIIYTWDIDPGTTPPPRQALITFDGPERTGEYRRPVKGAKVRFSVTVHGVGVYTADIASIDGRPTFPTPLPVTLSFPGC